MLTVRYIGRTGISVSLISAAASLVYCVVEGYAIFAVVGFLAMAIYFTPFIYVRNYQLISTWTYSGISIFLGCVLRGLYIAFQYPDFDTLNRYYFLGADPEYFIVSSIYFLMGLTAISLGYIVSKFSGKNASGRTEVFNYSSSRVYTFSFFAFLFSLVAIVAYVQLTGGFSALNISQKRSTIESIVLDESHRTWNSLRVIASISVLAHLLVLSDGFIRKKSGKPYRLQFTFAAILFVSSCFLPFYSSTRSDIVFYIIFSMSVIIYFGKNVPVLKLILVLFFAILIFQSMSVLRSSRNLGFFEAFQNYESSGTVFDSVVLNRNGIELAKTSHIIESIPQRLDWQYGKTVAVWLVAPIPREFWNSKPLISSGPVIGRQVYGNRVSGVPPGFIAEMYWNFHFLGVVLGGCSLGMLLKYVDTRFRPGPHQIPFFLFGPAQLGHMVLGVSLGYGVVNIAIQSVFAYLVYRYVMAATRVRSTPARTRARKNNKSQSKAVVKKPSTYMHIH